ncbi:hypothetical protein, partial [Klebsiella pneumoniae]|uniref:hypothetical protein n=1 Tax=Klebsiella pneumoniae TaxID=573 RepID=UPI00405570F0
ATPRGVKIANQFAPLARQETAQAPQTTKPKPLPPLVLDNINSYDLTRLLRLNNITEYKIVQGQQNTKVFCGTAADNARLAEATQVELIERLSSRII